MPMGEPRRGRQGAVHRGVPAPLDLGEPARPFGLDHAGGMLELVEVGDQALVGRETEVLGAQLVE
jgi:hypothetical protein